MIAPKRFSSFFQWYGSAVILVGAISVASAASYTFSSIGSEHAHVDGTGAAARFDDPYGIAVDRHGNVFVADKETIRKITPAGVVTTFAGSPGQAGHDDGVGGAARFSRLVGLAIDRSDNLYAISGYAVRKITPAGLVSTLAGNGAESGLADGPGVAARFPDMGGIAVDAGGNVYVSLTWRGQIRRITPQGMVSWLAGVDGSGDVDGPTLVATFGQPRGLAVDAAGNLYVATATRVRKITPIGDVSSLAGGDFFDSVDGTGAAARFAVPDGLAVDSAGNVYVADSATGRIRKVTASGIVTTIVDGAGSVVRFVVPAGIALDANGKLYVTDLGANTVRTISTTAIVATLAGAPGRHLDGPADKSLFEGPSGLGRDMAGNVFVADQRNHTIRKISPFGVVTTVAGTPGVGWIADELGIQTAFHGPRDVAVGSDGSLFVINPEAIRKISPGGVISTFAGATGQVGSVDGPGKVARFGSMERIAIDGQQNLYVTDAGNRTIRRIAPDATVTTLAGSAGMYGSADGMGAAARFASPRGIAVRANGNLIVVDNGSSTIREITPQGLVTTLAGLAGSAATVDGSNASARFSYPQGVSIDGADNIYVSQLAEPSSVRKITPAGLVTTEFIEGDAGWENSLWWDVVVDSSGALLIADDRAGLIRKAVPTGSVTPGPQPDPTAPASATRLVNISARGYCSTSDRVMIGGFVVRGAAAKRVLVRAVGPSLTAQGIGAGEVLLDPSIQVYKGASVIASNDNFNDALNAAEISTTAAQIGAAGLLESDTTSSALLMTLEPGVYSFIATGKNGASGIVLLEVYDADTGETASSSNFANIATRAYSTSGNGVTIGGFVISGNASKQVLLRAVGPTLTTQGIGEADVLVDPMIALHDARNGNAMIGNNDDWRTNTNATEITDTAARIGATPFDNADTRSSALLVTLAPGVYSFIASGKSATSGIVLVEVYDAD